MHHIEPFDNWTYLYEAASDELSPFYGEEHSLFAFSNKVYNYYIHPLWDQFGSRTLYLKVLFADYDANYAIIELIGEWNDAVENDIMELKRSVIDVMIQSGIYKYILITENVLNFHSSDDSYYEEWQDDIAEHGGWFVLLNMPPHCKEEAQTVKMHHYGFFMDYDKWRTHKPQDLFQLIDNQIIKYLA
jgi:hypothetical protein